MQKRAYRYRFYPTDEQAHNLACTFGCVRFVYNYALNKRKRAYFDHHIKLSTKDLSAAITALKREEGTAWLKEVSSVPLQQALRHLDAAYTNFFEGRAEYPTFKKKHHAQSATYTDNAFTLKGGKLTLAKQKEPLAKAQRKHARAKKGSKNRNKARKKVARLHARIADTRHDFQHKTSTKLIRENQVICLETLNVKGMLQNHKLAKAISDVGWGEFTRQLEYKAKWYGRTIIKIDRWYPSSKTCSDCGHVLDTLTLDVREWVCPCCGAWHDRDINAARVRRFGAYQISPSGR